MNKKYNKEDILDAGIALIRENGYSSTGIQHMLKACKIPKGSFYNFFESKEAFTKEAIKKYGEEHLNILKEIDALEGKSPVDKLKIFYRIEEEMEIQSTCVGTCFFISLSSEVNDQFTAFSTPISAQLDRLKVITTRWIKEGQDLGLIRKDYPAELIARNLQDTYNGALIRMKQQQNNTALHDFKTIGFELILST